MYTIDQTNIAEESFYNLSLLSDATKYANPLTAFKAHGVVVTVIKDNCGNIVKVVNAIGKYPINLN